MNPGIQLYETAGHQASGTLIVNSVPAAGATVTIASETYTMGTTFTGTTVEEVCVNLVTAINGDRSRAPFLRIPTISPLRVVWAFYIGNVIWIIAREPGTAGNALSLASSSGAVTASGATLAGGTAGGLISALTPLYSTSAASAASMSGFVKTVASSATPELLTAAPFACRTMTLVGRKAARTNNTGKAWLLHSLTPGTPGYEFSPGDERVFIAPPGTRFELNTLYVEVATNGDGLMCLQIG